MPSIHLWILAVALGCFVAGMSVGTTIFGQQVSEAATAAPGQDVGYADDLARRYGLSAAQMRSLRLVLQHERAEEGAIRASIAWSQLPPALQSRLLALRGLTRQRIRLLLDPEQRARFDHDSQPAAPASSETSNR